MITGFSDIGVAHVGDERCHVKSSKVHACTVETPDTFAAVCYILVTRETNS